MNQDFSKLSYKELQSLAGKHQIPGNIKKSQLVDFLRASKSGDKVHMTRMLAELKENRKRKVKKRKLEKMTVLTSTPLHSPNYSSIEDRFYSPQHLSPYHWATPEEEITRREDPHYEMFRQYLIQRIHKSYQNFDANNNDMGIESTALNLKAGAFESNPQSNILTSPTAPNTIMTPIPDAHKQMESQNANDANANNYRPMILQKMLQAPLGTNLGAMARHEATRMWPTEHYRSLRDLDDNNSDTITADSESIYDEWDERSDYYNVFDHRRAQNIFTEQNPIPQFTLEQMMNYFQSNNQNSYQHNSQFNYAPPNVQENCQTWIENNPLDFRGPVETTDSSKMYPSYSTEEQANYQYQTDGSLPVFGQNIHNENSGVQVQNMNSYYHHQLPAQQVPSCRAEYYDQTNSNNVCTNNAPFSTNVTQQLAALQTQDLTQYGIYQESATFTSYLGAEHFQHSYHQNQLNNQQPACSFASNVAQATYRNQTGEQNGLLKPTPGNAVPKEENNFLDPYWPKWSGINSEGLCLENILNLNTGSTPDYSKFQQTSSVYCFPLPLSSPLSGFSTSQHVELSPADRFHTFTPNSLIYSDSSTGMRMSKLPGDMLEEIKSDESNITMGYISDDSYRREPIQEIWIPDFNNQEEKDSKDFLSSSCETIPE